MRNLLVVIMILTASGCSSVGSQCSWVKDIRVVDGDVLTRATKEAVAEHRRNYYRECHGIDITN